MTNRSVRILYWMVTFALAAVGAGIAAHLPLVDFRVYLAAAEQLSRGADPYAAPYRLMLGPDVMELHYFYPPLLAVVLQPFVGLDSVVLSRAWIAVSILFLAIGVDRSIRATSPGNATDWRSIPALVLMVIAPPTIEGLYFGQVHTAVLALLGISLVSIAKAKESNSGAAIAAAAAVKISPALLLTIFSRRQLRAALSGFALVTIGVFLLGICSPRGLSVYSDFLHGAGAVTEGSRWQSNTENYSVPRLASLALGLGPVSVPIFSALIIVSGTLFIWVRRSDNDRSLEVSRRFCLGIIVMMAASPILWFHHLVWLLPCWLTARKVDKSSARFLLVPAAIVLSISMYVDVYLRAVVWTAGSFPATWFGPAIVLGPIAVLFRALATPVRDTPGL